MRARWIFSNREPRVPDELADAAQYCAEDFFVACAMFLDTEASSPKRSREPRIELHVDERGVQTRRPRQYTPSEAVLPFSRAKPNK